MSRILFFSFLFIHIFAKGYEAGKSKVGQGFRFGLVLGLFYVGSQILLMYPYMPIPNDLYVAWFIIGMVEFMILGIITGAMYCKKGAA